MHSIKFPCHLHTTFSMLDQSGNLQHKIKKSDSNKDYSLRKYDKPKAETGNQPYGIEKFAKRKKLTTDHQYIREDSIRLSVKVKEVK